MGLVADRLAAGGVLHLDWLAYATALIGGGRLDWGDTGAVAALYGKAQALLPSDLIVLPLDAAIAAHVGSHPALAASLAARPRGAQPLRTLLADAGLRAHLAAVVTQVGRAAATAMLAVSVADPLALARQAASLAGVAEPPADDDLADDASVYLADALRGLAHTPLAAIVIADADPRYAAFLAPVRKVAAHYGWDVGFRGPADPAFAFAVDTRPLILPAAPAQSGLHPVHAEIGPRPRAGNGAGAILSLSIPADGQPEAVLAAVAAIRKAMA